MLCKIRQLILLQLILIDGPGVDWSPDAAVAFSAYPTSTLSLKCVKNYGLRLKQLEDHTAHRTQGHINKGSLYTSLPL